MPGDRARVRSRGKGGPLRARRRSYHRRPSSRFRFWQRALEDQLAGLSQPRDLQPEVDAGDAVMIGDFFHRAGGAGELAFLERGREAFDQRVDESDIAVRQRLPGLANDALHGAVDLRRRGATVVDGELDQQQVGLVIEDVLLEPENAQVRSRAADGRIDLAHLGLGICLLEVGQAFGPPAFLGRDRPAEIADADLLAGGQFREEVGQSRPRRALHGGSQRDVIRRSGPSGCGKRDKQQREQEPRQALEGGVGGHDFLARNSVDEVYHCRERPLWRSANGRWTS